MYPPEFADVKGRLFALGFIPMNFFARTSALDNVPTLIQPGALPHQI